MVSPAFTSSGTRLPSSLDLPCPAAITLPCCGFSLAESGMMIEPARCADSSRRLTRIRSCSGLTFMIQLLGSKGGFVDEPGLLLPGMVVVFLFLFAVHGARLSA